MADDVNVTERILNKLNKIEEIARAGEISIVEIKMDLRAHMARTAAVEKNNELLEKKIDQANAATEKRLAKYDTWYDRFHFLGWLACGLLGMFEAYRRLH